MKRIIALLPILLLTLLSCKEKEAVEIVNLASSLYASLLNYQSVGFTVPEDIPLNQDLGASRTLSFTTRTEPVQMSLVRRGYDFSSLSHSLIHLRMQMEPQNYTGTVEVRVFVSPLVDVFNDANAVQIAERKIIPAMFDITGDDEKLNTYLLRDDFYIGFQFVLEPSLVTDRHVAVAGRIEEFELTVTGSRTLTSSYSGY